MDQRQSFNLTTDFFSGFTAAFIKLVFLLILVYLLILLLNFVRDKFINKEMVTKKEDMSDLLAILHKIFIVSGFGFIIANILQFLLNSTSQQNSNAIMNLRSEWEYLTFGTILIFVGIGFKGAGKVVKNNRLP
jgi:hypothetical protein